MTDKLNTIIKLLEGHNVFIQTHNFPDPDAVASAFGMQNLLSYFNINSTICYAGKAEKFTTLKMLNEFEISIKNIDEIMNMTPNDLIVTVDAQKCNSNVTDFIGKEVVCIDHHPDTHCADYKFTDIRNTGACSTIIAEYYFDNQIPLDRKIATALIYGIKTDTADFLRGVCESDVAMYHKLFPLADNELLSKMQRNTMEFTDLKAYGMAIQNIKIYDNVGYAYIPFNCPDALIAMISDFILALDIIEFSVVYADRGNGYKLSVRSEIPSLDAGKITSSALKGIGSGGGHSLMAGGYVDKSMLTDINVSITTVIRNAFSSVISKNAN